MIVKLETVKELEHVEKFLKGYPTRIWSEEHRAYYRPKGQGYVGECAGARDGAGVWKFEDALANTKHCDPSKEIHFEVSGVHLEDLLTTL